MKSLGPLLASTMRLLLMLGSFSLCLERGTAVEVDPYAWEFPVVTGITNADSLREELREQVRRVLDAGRLAPLYISYSDQQSVGYTVYQEPGRIITALAWAYPHLTGAQRVALRAYVNHEFNNPTNAPWGVTSYGKNGNSNYPVPRTSGAPREEHPRERWWYSRNDFGNARPFLHTLYGVWLYGYRTGDWTAISNHWPAIQRIYSLHGSGDAYKLYGTLGVHIALARLADRFADAAARAAAITNLQIRLDAGLDFAATESLCRGTPGNEWRSPYGSYPNMYDSRMNGSTYHGWMFLNLPPEIGRYLRDAAVGLRSNVLARHASGKAAFPLWWMPKASYFNRSWTGDEGSGLVPEVLGMIAPIERWVVRADAATLRRQMRSAPNGVGDCYWLEALVQAIEAHGSMRWVDVRRPDLEPPAISNVRWEEGGPFGFHVEGSPHQHYEVEVSGDLLHWASVQTSDVGSFDFNETAALPTPRFYRARFVP